MNQPTSSEVKYTFSDFDSFWLPSTLISGKEKIQLSSQPKLMFSSAKQKENFVMQRERPWRACGGESKKRRVPWGSRSESDRCGVWDRRGARRRDLWDRRWSPRFSVGETATRRELRLEKQRRRLLRSSSSGASCCLWRCPIREIGSEKKPSAMASRETPPPSVCGFDGDRHC